MVSLSSKANHRVTSLATKRLALMPLFLMLGLVGLACTPPGAPRAAPPNEPVFAHAVSQQATATPTASIASLPPLVPSSVPSTVVPTSVPVTNAGPPPLSSEERERLGPAGASLPPVQPSSLPSPPFIPPTPEPTAAGTRLLSQGFPAFDPNRAAPPVPSAPSPPTGVNLPAAAPQATARSTPLPTVAPPYHVGVSGFGDPPPSALVQHASLIVRGTVKQVGPTRWTTPDGKKPAGYDKAPAFGVYSIYRPIYLTVHELYKGQLEEQEIILFAPGGGYAEESLTYEDQAFHYRPGDGVVVFASHKGLYLGGRKMWNIEGKYRIEDGIAKQNVSTRPADDLIYEIKAEVNP